MNTIKEEDLQVELILEEAQIYGLRLEVKQEAEKELSKNKKITRVEAYENAFLKWIK